MGALSLSRPFPTSLPQASQAGRRERAHLSLERSWQVASIPAFGWRAKGLSSERPRRLGNGEWISRPESDVGAGNAWSGLVTAACVCLCLGHAGHHPSRTWVRGVSDSQCFWANSKAEAPWVSEVENGKECFKNPPPILQKGKPRPRRAKLHASQPPA